MVVSGNSYYPPGPYLFLRYGKPPGGVWFWRKMNHWMLHPGARHQKSDPAGLSHVRVKAVSTKWDVKVTKAYTATFCTDKENSYVLAEFDSNGYGFGMDLMSMQNRRNFWICQLSSLEASRIVQSSLPSALYDTLLYLTIRPVCTPSSWVCLLLGFAIPHALTRYNSLEPFVLVLAQWDQHWLICNTNDNSCMNGNGFGLDSLFILNW